MRTEISVLDHLKDINDKHSYKRIKFTDGSLIVDVWTAKAMLYTYNSVKETNKSEFHEEVTTKSRFLQLANFSYKNTSFSYKNS